MSRFIHRQGFSASSWNFLEAGHGKGAPDGFGGCLKRAADCILAKGQDLPTPFDVYTALRTACPGILLCYVPASVTEQHGDLPSTLRPVRGTMALHQVVTTQPCQMIYRDVSCTCPVREECECYTPRRFLFQDETTSMVQHIPSAGYISADVDGTGVNATGVQVNTSDVGVGVSSLGASVPGVEAVASGVQASVNGGDSACGIEAGVFGEESDTIIAKHASNANEEILVPVLSPSEDVLGAWVAVRYDERIYPGIIMSMTTEVVEVKAMQIVGSNRYRWPLHDDVIPYEYNDILSRIRKPERVTRRREHFRIDASMYRLLELV